MRYMLTILGLVLRLLSFGQALSELEMRLRLIDNPGEFKYDTNGFSMLPKIDHFCDNENQNQLEYYHVGDLNGDGLNDLIYSTPCKPYRQTGIFLNAGHTFKKIHNSPGGLVSIEKRTSSTIIHILKSAWGCDYFSEYIAITVDTASNVTKNTIAFEANTKIKLGTRLKVAKVVGTIRATPEINDVSKKDTCRNQIIKGNQITRIDKFKDIIQLNRVGSWWLVLYQQNKERSWIGWMKMNK